MNFYLHRMIFTEILLNKLLHKRNLNVLVHGPNTDIFNTLELANKTSHNIDYRQKDDIYMINNKSSNKDNIIGLITEVSAAPNFYSEDIRKKVIILLNIQNLKHTYILKIKSIVESSHETACFILHTKYVNKLDYTIRSRFIVFFLPSKTNNDETISISYNRIVGLVKEGLTKKTIEDIREVCYMYYMNHNSSIELQQYIVKEICRSITLPNQIKYAAIKDIVDVNHLYAYSYRKPLYLECIIYSLFKHLEYYTI